MALIDLESAQVHYDGQVVLKSVSLKVRPGERIAVVGKSGSGKSTLLRLLYQQQAQHSALIPQDLGLVKRLSVFHNIYMGRLDQHAGWYNLANLARPWQAQIRAIAPIVEQLGLQDKLFTPVGELSGGQQQRTAIGRALFQGGDLLIGDEPVSAVDAHQAETLLRLLRARYPTLLLALHDTRLALNYCDRVLGIKEGELVMDAASRTLRTKDLDFLYHSA